MPFLLYEANCDQPSPQPISVELCLLEGVFNPFLLQNWNCLFLLIFLVFSHGKGWIYVNLTFLCLFPSNFNKNFQIVCDFQSKSVQVSLPLGSMVTAIKTTTFISPPETVYGGSLSNFTAINLILGCTFWDEKESWVLEQKIVGKENVHFSQFTIGFNGDFETKFKHG